MSKDYQVELAGDPMDLGVAAGYFTHGPIRITESSGKYGLDFPELAQLTDVHEVYNRASEILREVSVALRLVHDQQRRITVGAIRVADEKGEHRAFFLAAETGHLRITGGHVSFTHRRADGSTVDHGPSLPEKSAALALFDPVVRRVIRLYAEFEHDGALLYKIYELVRDDVGGETAIVRDGLVTNAEQNAFTGSINRADVLGDFARHAISRGAPPKRTLDPKECMAFIKTLVSKWIATKHRIAVHEGRITERCAKIFTLAMPATAGNSVEEQ